MDEPEHNGSPAKRLIDYLGLTYSKSSSSPPPKGWFARINWIQVRVQELEQRVSNLEQGRLSGSSPGAP
jgi:biotin synthase-related radical SAM superfamily protein